MSKMSPKSAWAFPHRVFVVYGRNDKARVAVFDFLRALGLDPVEWPRAVVESGGGPNPHVDAVVRAELEKVGGVVVVFTPDDIALLRNELALKPDPHQDGTAMAQPRQNVLYEAGMAMCWDQKRTVMVQIGNVRILSDVVGRLILRLDNSPEKRTEFRSRLVAAKLPVADGTTDFLNKGDFDGAVVGLDVPVQSVTQPALSPSQPTQTTLTQTARDFLAAAASHCSRRIVLAKSQQGLVAIVAGKTHFKCGQDPRAQARFEHAIDELVNASFIEDSGNGTVFRVTHDGFTYNDGHPEPRV